MKERTAHNPLRLVPVSCCTSSPWPDSDCRAVLGGVITGSLTIAGLVTEAGLMTVAGLVIVADLAAALGTVADLGAALVFALGVELLGVLVTEADTGVITETAISLALGVDTDSIFRAASISATADDVLGWRSLGQNHVQQNHLGQSVLDHKTLN